MEGADEEFYDIPAANFGDKDYNIAVFHKVQIVGRILASGFNVIYFDSDVVLLKDPIPFILPNNVDFRAVTLRSNRTGWTDPALMKRWDSKLSQFQTGQFFLRVGKPAMRFQSGIHYRGMPVSGM